MITVRAIVERDGRLCCICGGLLVSPARSVRVKYFKTTIEHRKPKSKGGTDKAENLGVAHAICNSVRGNLPLSKDICCKARKALAMQGYR